MELCPELGITIPVGKDSMSMRTVWDDNGEQKSVTAPMSLIISGFAPVLDARKTLTPQLRTDKGETDLILLDLGNGQNRMGLSALAQVYNEVGNSVPDVDDATLLANFFDAIQSLNEQGLLLAYHDRADGGLLVTIAEMGFAGRTGVDLNLDLLAEDTSELAAALFNEELGAVIQIRRHDMETVFNELNAAGLGDVAKVIGTLNPDLQLNCFFEDEEVYSADLIQLQRWWSETSFRIQALRDNSECAQQEFRA
jgi:phosphoribosylformylglycinamidine synthase